MKRLQERIGVGLVIIALFVSCSITVQAASADINGDGDVWCIDYYAFDVPVEYVVP